MSAARPPDILARHADLLPVAGHALDLACGQGGIAVWLARRGLEVRGFDVSPVAIGQARDLARRSGVGDVDDGLPNGPPVELLVCHRFRDPRLDAAILGRLKPGGLLAIAVLSEAGAAPGPFRAAPGELPAAFPGLRPLAVGEELGHAWLLARA